MRLKESIKILIKQLLNSMKVPKNVPMSSPIVKEEDSLEMPSSPIIVEEDLFETQFIIDLKLQFDNFCENVHDFTLEDKTSVEDNEVIDLFEFSKEDKQPPLDLSIESNNTIYCAVISS